MLSILSADQIRGVDGGIWLPDDPSVFDVRDFGAIGDGVADDTAALQAAIDESGSRDAQRVGIVFIPNGTYRVTETLVANRGKRGSGVGPWIWGQSRERTVIRLADGVAAKRLPMVEAREDAARADAEVRGLSEEEAKKERSRWRVENPPDGDDAITSVLRLHPYDGGVRTSANWFMRNVRHLTIDVGDNPTVDAIRYHATNVGIVEDVAIRGRGSVGINARFLGESGPNLVQNVTIEGFDVGIASAWCYGQTLCGVTIRDCRDVGVELVANTVGIERLHVDGTPQAVRLRYPKTHHWWSGNAAILDSTFECTDASKAAIENMGLLYLRNVSATGSARLLDDNAHKSAGGPIEAMSIDEYASHKTVDVDDRRRDAVTSVGLESRRAPEIDWERDASKWVCVNEYGLLEGSGEALGERNTRAWQDAIDAAAASGATTVYARAVRRFGNPDAKAAHREAIAGLGKPQYWYTMSGTVRIHGSVRHIIGLGFARTLGGGTFRIDDGSADIVRIENINVFGKSTLHFVNASADRTLVLDSVSGTATTSGPLFITNAPMSVRVRPGGRVWARHLNAEGTGTEEEPLVINDGGELWAVGIKSEGRGPRFLTLGGGKTEIFGTYQYSNVPVSETDDWPLFEVRGEKSRLFVAPVKEVNFNGRPYRTKLRVDGRDLTREILKGRQWCVLSVGND